MPQMTCPECNAVISLRDGDAKAGRTARCTQCGVSVPVRTTGEAPVTFPQRHKDETMLDLSEAVKEVRKRRKKS